MPIIQFTCPYCFKKTRVDESYAGKSGPCVACGKNVVVPEIAVRSRPVELAQGLEEPGSTTELKPGLNRESKGEFKKGPSVFGGSTGRMFIRWGVRLAALAVGIGLFSAMVFYLFWPTLVGLKARRDKTACMANLMQIANALNAYASKHGSYPTPIVYDSAGKPLHSWRVLILQELGEPALFARYNFSEPWDSADNLQLLGSNCPSVYISPGVVGGTRGVSETNYFLITGPGTLFPPSGPLAPKQIADLPSNTLLAVESDINVVEWTKPQDIDITKLNPRINASGADTIGGTHAGGATAVFADGAAAWLPDDLPAALLDAIISPGGGEPVDASRFQLR